MTIADLLDLVKELHVSRDEEHEGAIYELIRVREALFREIYR